MYGTFALACLLVIVVFVTSKTYVQLAIATLLYPPLVYFALKILPRRTNAPAVVIQLPTRHTPGVEEADRKKVDVVDIDKRTFLKLIGTTGISFFLFSLFGRRLEALLFGKSFEGGANLIGTAPSGDQITQGTQSFEGYKISEVDDNVVSYYGFTNKNGAWLIMREDTQTSSFRYAKGETDFARSWSSRATLKYDYYFNLF